MAGLSFLGIPLAFTYPWVLTALALLPLIWWLLRLTPPRPISEPFPPTKILAELISREETPARSPWWLTLLRLLIAMLIIFAMAVPVWNPRSASLSGDGPLLLVIDNTWASASNWQGRLASAKTIIEEATAAKRQIIPILTSADARQKVEIVATDNLKLKLASWTNNPNRPDYALAAQKIRVANRQYSPTSLVFLSDGLSRPGIDQLAKAMRAKAAQKILFVDQAKNAVIINSVENQPDAMGGEVVRANSSGPQVFTVTGYDLNGATVTRKRINFADGEAKANFSFEVPVELRNEIVRVVIEEVQNAGAVQLLDESNRRRLVGLISGAKHDNAQPLLSPLYYISRALEPFSDIRRSEDANVAKALTELITRGVSTIVLADIGLLPAPSAEQLRKWVGDGGMLIRFAGPRLAASPDNRLLPVRLRRGDRNLGGALSWEKPKPVAEFELTSPFFGLRAPRDVFVTRQVLALQESGLSEKTWARLSDGTPLVTASKMGQGWSVLFHVSSDASWSNLPISGTFVEMLRRVVNQSRSSLAAGATASSQTLPPLRLLNGKGQLIPPGIEAKPASFAKGNITNVSLANPPGFYGTSDGFRALNLFNGEADLKLLDKGILGDDTILAHYAGQQPISLKPWALLALALLLIADCTAVLWMAGQLHLLGIFRRSRISKQPAKAAILLLGILLIFHGGMFPALAQSTQQNDLDSAQDALSEDFDFSPSLRTRLAYVLTGIAEVDDISLAGLRGLSKYLTERTAIEPGPPIGVDISRDELAFYPIIYWPVHIASEVPEAATMARIDAYMKQGGSVLFDTRDQLSGFSGGTLSSPEAIRLQQILANLDIPALEPVPSDHVLTKSFFIVSDFPGRYSGGELWVEQLPEREDFGERPVRIGDGVSSILITSNDLAGAWAIDRNQRPMFATVPPSTMQREIAYRVGVNLIMYAMTGNYKSDQVHIPALLERLSQ